MKRWFFFFFLVAVLTALVALGAFTDGTARETPWPVGFGKVLFLSLLGLAAAAFMGWTAFLSGRRERRSPPPSGYSGPPSLRDTLPSDDPGRDQLRARH
jgi:hypothetical protein